MRNYKIIITTLLFTASYVNVLGQTKSYPFEIQKSGQGKQSIIFIPGFACSGEVWNETKSKFQKDYTYYTLTMSGFAGVQPQPNPTFENWKKGIANYIKDHQIEKPILIGHSMGGGLAMAIASDYPNLIDRIIVVDGLPFLAAVMNPESTSNENLDCSSMVQQITALSDEQFFQIQKMSMPRLLEDKSMLEKVVSWSVTSDRKTFAEMYCDFSNTDLRDKIKTIECPSLILLESYFKNFKPTIAAQYKNLKYADIQYADKGLHFIMYDDKDWYFTQLSNFLKK